MQQQFNFLKTLPIDLDNDIISIQKFNGYNLAAPKSFWDSTDSIRKNLTGGCGSGRIGDFFVPDRIYCLKITAACIIHDWCFLVWNSKEGFIQANNLFKNNIIRIIQQTKSNRIIKKLRFQRSRLYYQAVKYFGEPSYFDSHLDLL